MVSLEDIVEAGSVYSESEFVYRAGKPFEYIYAVKSGMFKTVLVDSQGAEHIVGFHLPGELFGLDAIYSQQYGSNAVSLGTSSLCAIRYSDLEVLAQKLPSLQHQLLSLMSKEVHTSFVKTHDQTVDQKLAGFLVALAARYKQRGYSETRFHLVMARRDIANHLNMAPETISRLFKRFQADGLIEVKRTDLHILNMDALKTLSGCLELCSSPFVRN
jgi:CRP/FNR family transcriptional regulator